MPPILHRDVKTHNILLGDRYEPCLADFGLARFLEDETGSFSAYPQFAGSYGYFALLETSSDSCTDDLYHMFDKSWGLIHVKS
ncbi:UNVERIFIED_CONTAM: Leucine-rich repeat receptor-like serine/threonine-protein kinase BAM1, partial [Sesamum calycinum]